MDKRKIILDVDTGTDDAMAIIMAALSPDIELKAITCTHGNLPLPNTVDNTLRVVEMLGIDVPVYSGCAEPMAQWLRPGRVMNPRRQHQVDSDGRVSMIHEEHLPLPEPTIRAEEKHAVSFLVDTFRKEKLTLVAVGPATNVAMALRMDPSIADNIEELVVMGGGVHCSNATQSAEFNFYLDPEAAEIMMRANCKITVFPLDATTSALFSIKDGEDIKAVGTEPAEFFSDLVIDFCRRMEAIRLSNTDDPNQFECAIHDALCILYLIDPKIATDLRRQSAFVDFSGGYADGALLVDTRSYMELMGETYIAYKADKQRIKDLIIEILSGNA